jgi:hypothetical protein
MVTADGAVHLIVNTGVLGPGTSPSTDALQMYSSTDGGAIWVLQPLYYGTTDIFANTTGGGGSYTTTASTTDVAVVPPGGAGGESTMTLIFTDQNNTAVEEAQLSWNGSSWSVTQFSSTPVLTAPSGYTYTMPSYVAENQGNSSSSVKCEYLAVVETDTESGVTQIPVFYNTDKGAGPSYYNTGVALPGSQPLHAPRLVWLPGIADVQSVGLLYQAEDSSGNAWLCWEAMVANVNNTMWTLFHPNAPDEQLFQMPNAQNVAYNSGFSVATVVTADGTDAPGTQYLAYLANTGSGSFIQTAVYTPYSSGAPASWGHEQTLTNSANDEFYTPSYVKLTYTGSSVYVFFDYRPVGGSANTLYIDTLSASTPFGSCSTCYTPTYQLTTPAPPVGATWYQNPRIDAPEYVTSDYIPVWLQYEPSGTTPYSLLFWSVPWGG